VKFERAPRSKKRLSCDLTIDGHRYKGIVLDVSASGLFVQTNVKSAPGARVGVAIVLPGLKDPVQLDARVARKKPVPAALLTAAQGGLGLAIEKAPKAYLDFVGEMSPEQADYLAGQTPASGAGEAPGARSRWSTGGASAPKEAPAKSDAAVHFRIHAVETATGKRNPFLVRAPSEAAATEEVLAQLGDGWQVIFVERV